jgi:hypothetical protein
MEHERSTDRRAQRAERPVLTAADHGASPAAQTWGPLVEPGMVVVGAAGDAIGQVKEVRAGDFLVDRSGSLGLGADGLIFLPFERIHAMLADRITLDVTSSQVDEYGTVPSALEL